MVTIGLVGCGAIGTHLAREIQHRFKESARLIGVYDANLSQAHRLAGRLRPPVPVLSPGELIRRSQLLVEAASVSAARSWLPRATARGRPILVLSSGSLLTWPKLLRQARARRVPVYLPSGAIAGLDGVRAAAMGRLVSVHLVTRKPPAAFAGAPGLRRRIRLEKLRRPRVLFRGPATQAARAFPQNVNVAATLALAGLGGTRTRVTVIADPSVRSNIHEITATGSFGKLRVRVENRPSENPRTSRLAMQSATAMLARILEPVQVGT